MANPSEKSEEQLITEAIGAHGVYFKKALRATLEGLPNVGIIGEEYPVKYLDGTAIDLLAIVRGGNGVTLLPIECKRALALHKKWIFFRGNERNVKLVYAFQGQSLQVKQSDAWFPDMAICSEGLEIDVTKLSGSKSPYAAASADRIWASAFQACKGGLGFIRNELMQRQKTSEGAQNFGVILIVVTTAPLEIAELSESAVDLVTGNHVGELKTTPVKWLILHYPFTPKESVGGQHLEITVPGYVAPELRGLQEKEGIVFVNSSHIPEFIKMLARLGVASQIVARDV